MKGTMDVWSMIRDERTSLVALLETLSPEEWDAPSLCGEWRVRDVVGHLVAELSLSGLQSTLGLVKAGFNMNAFIGKEGTKFGAKPTDELLAFLQANIASE